MKKRLLKVKWENILLVVFIPLAIIQFYKANIDLKLVSIMMSLILYGGTYLTIQVTRQEALFNARYEKEQPILKPILNMLSDYLKAQKKRLPNKRYINDQAYILRASFK